jgi:hypothetical protein
MILSSERVEPSKISHSASRSVSRLTKTMTELPAPSVLQRQATQDKPKLMGASPVRKKIEIMTKSRTQNKHATESTFAKYLGSKVYSPKTPSPNLRRGLTSLVKNRQEASFSPWP